MGTTLAALVYSPPSRLAALPVAKVDSDQYHCTQMTHLKIE